MDITRDEKRQIKRLSKSSWIDAISDAALRSLDQETLSNMLAAYLYFKSHGRPDKDFLSYVTMNERWSTMAIGLNIMGVAIPAMIFDKEFRALVVKTGINKGSEIASQAVRKKARTTDIKEGEENPKRKEGTRANRNVEC